MKNNTKIVESVFEKTEGIVFKGYKDAVNMGLKAEKEINKIMHKNLDQVDEVVQMGWEMHSDLLNEIEKNIKTVSQNYFDILESAIKPWSHQ
ncbi:hypothetical protein ACFL35_04715 [Candidatus Riflebacteria bacterium]